MVEGHQCHRVAAAHRRLLVGRAFQARSPNGRFKEGAAAINAKPLQRIEVHGKNLFYFFGAPPPLAGPASAPPTAQAAPARPAAAAAAPTPAPPDSTPPAPTTRGSRKRAAEAVERASTFTFASAAPAAAAAATAAAAGVGSAAAADPVVVVMHVHFGMSGAFRTLALPGPPPTATTRLELVNQEMGLVAHLSAMTVAHGSLALYQSKAAQLGEDPLREDADKEVLWSRVSRSRKSIGLVLMDQSLVAGVGNIYRAEILFKAGIHPETPAAAISREEFDRIWYHSVDLLQRGFVGGSIITVDPQEAARLGRPWTRRYIYNQKQCGRCKGPVRTWSMAARTVYCCETCQPLKVGPAAAAADDDSAAAAAAAGAGGGAGGAGPSSPLAVAAMAALSPARLAAMAAGRPARVFRSHCAPDDPEDEGLAPEKLTVKELRGKLTALNLDTRGTKATLVQRLQQAARWEQQQQPKQDGQQEEPQQQQGQEGGQAHGTRHWQQEDSSEVVVITDDEEGEEEEVEEEREELHMDVGGGDEDGDEVVIVEKVGSGRLQAVGAAATAAAGAAAVRAAAVGAAAGLAAGRVRGGTPGARRSRRLSAASAAAEMGAPSVAGLAGGSSGSSGGGGADSGSEEALDVAERILTESMTAADAPGTAPVSPLLELPRLPVVQLRARLRQLGLPTSGTKPTILARLTAALAEPTAAKEEADAAPPAVGAATSPLTPSPGGAAAAAVAAPPPAPEAKPPTTPPPPAQAEAAAAASARQPATPKRPRKARETGAADGPGTPTAGRRRLSPVSPLGGPDGPTAAAAAGRTAATAPAERRPGGGGLYDIQPGIRGLERKMASAKDAALEKLLAGENRAVEHVALEDEEVVDLLAEAPTGRGRARKRAREAAAAIEAAAAATQEEEDEEATREVGSPAAEGLASVPVPTGEDEVLMERGRRLRSRKR